MSDKIKDNLKEEYDSYEKQKSEFLPFITHCTMMFGDIFGDSVEAHLKNAYVQGFIAGEANQERKEAAIKNEKFLEYLNKVSK